MTAEEYTIRVAMARSRVTNRKELSDSTGINDQTMRNRFRHPGGMRLYELRSIDRELVLTDAELLAIARGKEVEMCER